jgi:hypothetical protein
MRVGDRVVTVTGRRGVLQPPLINMPLYHLVKFDDGALLWMLKDVVVVDPAAVSKKRKTAKAKSKKPVDNLRILSYGCKLVQPNCIGLIVE